MRMHDIGKKVDLLFDVDLLDREYHVFLIATYLMIATSFLEGNAFHQRLHWIPELVLLWMGGRWIRKFWVVVVIFISSTLFVPSFYIVTQGSFNNFYDLAFIAPIFFLMIYLGFHSTSRLEKEKPE